MIVSNETQFLARQVHTELWKQFMDEDHTIEFRCEQMSNFEPLIKLALKVHTADFEGTVNRFEASYASYAKEVSKWKDSCLYPRLVKAMGRVESLWDLLKDKQVENKTRYRCPYELFTEEENPDGLEEVGIVTLLELSDEIQKDILEGLDEEETEHAHEQQYFESYNGRWSSLEECMRTEHDDFFDGAIGISNNSGILVKLGDCGGVALVKWV